MLYAAKKSLQKVHAALEPYVNSGLPVIMMEPSCASVFRDELRGLFPQNGIAHRLRQQTFTLSSFLQSEALSYQPPRLPGRKVLLHGHCHHKAVLKFADEEALLRRMGVELKSLDSGCCGMGGPVGFEGANTTISPALGERVLFSAERASGPRAILIAEWVH